MSGVFAHAVDSEVIDANPLRDLRMRIRGKALEVDPLTRMKPGFFSIKPKGAPRGPLLPALPLRPADRYEDRGDRGSSVGGHRFQRPVYRGEEQQQKGKLTDTKNRKRRRVDMTPQLAEA